VARTRISRGLEEAWIIHALVREDGMSQVEVAELLGRHKRWVCRAPRSESARRFARGTVVAHLGAADPTFAEGNQAEVLDAARREALSGAELTGLVDLWLGCADRGQQQLPPGASP